MDLAVGVQLVGPGVEGGQFCFSDGRPVSGLRSEGVSGEQVDMSIVQAVGDELVQLLLPEATVVFAVVHWRIPPLAGVSDECLLESR